MCRDGTLAKQCSQVYRCYLAAVIPHSNDRIKVKWQGFSTARIRIVVLRNTSGRNGGASRMYGQIELRWLKDSACSIAFIIRFT